MNAKTSKAIRTETADGRSAVQVSSVDGVIRVFVPGKADTTARSAARSVACKVHGSIAVGRTPEATAAKQGTVQGHTWSFTPVSSNGSPKAPKANGKGNGKVTRTAPKATPLEESVGTFAALTAELDGVIEHLHDLQERIGSFAGGHLAVDELPTVKVTRREAKPARELPSWLTKETPDCTSCKDFRLVKAIGPNAGLTDGSAAYKTANGADEANSKGHAMPCPKCSGTKSRKGRKSA